jgi:hypothetical protein
MILFQTKTLNICYTLAISLIMMKLIEEKRYSITLLLISPLIIIDVEYGIYGVLTVMLMKYIQTKPIETMLIYSALTLIYSYSTNQIIQLASIPVFIILAIKKGYDKKLIPFNNTTKILKYSIYPVHILLLLLYKARCLHW